MRKAGLSWSWRENFSGEKQFTLSKAVMPGWIPGQSLWFSKVLSPTSKSVFPNVVPTFFFPNVSSSVSPSQKASYLASFYPIWIDEWVVLGLWNSLPSFAPENTVAHKKSLTWKELLGQPSLGCGRGIERVNQRMCGKDTKHRTWILVLSLTEKGSSARYAWCQSALSRGPPLLSHGRHHLGPAAGPPESR